MRITGGALRSRRLVAPSGTATRPTSDRVREALFSILAGYVTLPGARVLDLYAGSGALSFEALSRGAEHATLVDTSRDAIASARANAAALGVAARVRLVASGVERALDGTIPRGATFEIIFADPPYADVSSGLVPRVLSTAELASRVAPRGIVVLEHASREEPPALTGLVVADARRYGDTAIALYQLEAHAAHEGASEPA